ncbi:MAG TPA: HAMP domain-containing sensor histidine kinase [Candidatus Binatia bacterium]|nr:HAMP domain-containing sensor histidine kinase [Candidatus Binatia bacterium]
MKRVTSNPGLDINRIIHEIGNPLNGILTSIQLMERHLASHHPAGDEFFATSLRNLKSEINRLQCILLDARSLPKSPAQLEPMDLRHVIDSVLLTQKPEFSLHGIRIVKEFSPDLPPIRGDRTKLQQVFINLFKNSIEAMPDGGTLRLRTFGEKQFVVLEIADTGVGMAKDVSAFEAHTTTKPGGMGLGLAIVREIVEAHGGGIIFETEEGKGTRFRLTFIQARRSRNWREKNSVLQTITMRKNG